MMWMLAILVVETVILTMVIILIAVSVLHILLDDTDAEPEIKDDN